jgi:hypothetical protein
MVEKNNIPLPNEEKHVQWHIYVMLMNGTYKLMTNTKHSNKSEKKMSMVGDDHIQTVPRQNTSQ